MRENEGRMGEGRSGSRWGTSSKENKEELEMSKNIRKDNPLTERKMLKKARESNEAARLLSDADKSPGLKLAVPEGNKKPKNLFVWALGLSALTVAGCAAFFSVRGISLLFAGSMAAVVVMATGLEYGKLVAASYLYRYWSKTTLMLKSYLITAVVVLIGVTSLGIYGFLSDAFEKTRTAVALYEENILALEKENTFLYKQIESSENSVDQVSEKADSAIESYKDIYDDFISQQNDRRDVLISRRNELDASVAELEASPGGLFSSKKKRVEELKTSQSQERSSIRESLNEIESQNKSEYDSFLAKVKAYRDRSEDAADSFDVTEVRSKISSNNNSILTNKELISNTDIGSFKFIATAFDVPLDNVVKWFILCIVLVFDPLSVTLVLAYNVALKNEEDK